MTITLIFTEVRPHPDACIGGPTRAWLSSFYSVIYTEDGGLSGEHLSFARMDKKQVTLAEIEKILLALKMVRNIGQVSRVCLDGWHEDLEHQSFSRSFYASPFKASSH